MKTKDFIEKVEYQTYRVKPISSIRNYNSSKIAKAVSTMHRGLIDSIQHQGLKFRYKELAKITYMIHFTKKETSFYFVLPVEYQSLFKEKILSTWKGVTIEEAELPPLIVQIFMN